MEEILKAVKEFFEFHQPAKKKRENRGWALRERWSRLLSDYDSIKPANVTRDVRAYYVYVIIFIRTHQAPDGFLRSKFIAPFTTQYLRYAKGSVLDPAFDAKTVTKRFMHPLAVAWHPFLSMLTIVDHRLRKWNAHPLRS